MQKIIIPVAIVALLAVGGLVALGGSEDATSNIESTASEAITVDLQSSDESSDESSDDTTVSAEETTADSESEASTEEAQSEEVAETEAEVAVVSGNYINYSDGVIENTPGTKVVFFHADWCPNCNALEADINASGVKDGVTIIKANFDDETDLKDRYGVNFQTTVVLVDDQGDLIQSHYAGGDPTVEGVYSALGI